jgi:hypothetical protein
MKALKDKRDEIQVRFCVSSSTFMYKLSEEL